ncbi:MAG: DUF6113 family protein [Actinomycetota bacterium]|nr:DUF6113 family protein [Actinomycetota bacterium]
MEADRVEDDRVEDDRGEQVERGVAFALVLLLALLTGLWGAFLVPLRVGGVALPVSVLLAGVGNGVLCWAGGQLLGRLGAGLPGLLWFAVAVLLQTRRPEGDLVVPGTWTGLLFLVVGSLAAAVAVGLAPPGRRPATDRSAVGARPAAGVPRGT